MVRSRVGVLTALCGAALLSGCFLFPPFFPPGEFPMGDETLVVENATGEDWVLSLVSEVSPTTFAIPAGRTGEVATYGFAPTAVALLDPECEEVDSLDWDASFIGVRIEGAGTLAGAETVDAADPESFAEYWECFGGLGAAPEAGEALSGGSGSILLAGNDGSAWSLDVVAGELDALSTGDVLEGEHALSPDGTRIAFSRYGEMDASSAIYLADVGGGNEELLLEDAAGPVWSPDGTRIAFSNLDPFAGGAALGVIEVASGEALELADEGSAPRWSPDGTRIAFTVEDIDFAGFDDVPPSELHIVNADGTGLRTLAEAAPFAAAPTWSPDATLIAFAALPDGAEGGDPLSQEMVIKVYDLADDSARIVAEIAGSSLSEPTWSPDGERLAFVAMSTGLFRTSAAIAIGTPDGGAADQIGTLENGYYMAPLWSPDGAWIAVTRTAGMEMSSDLVAIDVASGDEVVLATGVLYATAWLGDQLRD